MKAIKLNYLVQIWKNVSLSLHRILFRYTPKSQDDLTLMLEHFNSHLVPPRVLFLGDSVAERVSLYDRDRKSLGEMVKSNLGIESNVACITHSAYHMKVYYYILSTLKKMQYQPEIVILPINLRSFSPQWDFEPTWQFTREIQSLKDFLGVAKDEDLDSNATSNELGTKEQYEHFDARVIDYPLSPFKHVGEFRLLINAKPGTNMQKDFRMKQIFVFHYLHPLLSTHPKVVALEKNITLLKSLDISLVAYITPINYQGGERYLGEQFISLLQTNAKVIHDCFLPYTDSSKVSFLDLSEFLTSDYFFHINEPTEHLNQQGRAKLSKTIAKEIRQLMISIKDDHIL